MKSWLEMLSIACPVAAALVLFAIAAALHLGYPEPRWLMMFCTQLLLVTVLVTTVAAAITHRYRWAPRSLVDLVRPSWYYYTVPAPWLAVGATGFVTMLLSGLRGNFYLAYAGLALIMTCAGQMRLRDPADGDTMPWNVADPD